MGLNYSLPLFAIGKTVSYVSLRARGNSYLPNGCRLDFSQSLIELDRGGLGGQRRGDKRQGPETTVCSVLDTNGRREAGEGSWRPAIRPVFQARATFLPILPLAREFPRQFSSLLPRSVPTALPWLSPPWIEYNKNTHSLPGTFVHSV